VDSKCSLYALFSYWPYTGISVLSMSSSIRCGARTSLGLANEFAVEAGQATEVLLLGQHLGHKSLQTGSQRRSAIPRIGRLWLPAG